MAKWRAWVSICSPHSSRCSSRSCLSWSNDFRTVSGTPARVSLLCCSSCYALAICARMPRRSEQLCISAVIFCSYSVSIGYRDCCNDYSDPAYIALVADLKKKRSFRKEIESAHALLAWPESMGPGSGMRGTSSSTGGAQLLCRNASLFSSTSVSFKPQIAG
jgi:hypothetical protein